MYSLNKQDPQYHLEESCTATAAWHLVLMLVTSLVVYCCGTPLVAEFHLSISASKLASITHSVFFSSEADAALHRHFNTCSLLHKTITKAFFLHILTLLSKCCRQNLDSALDVAFLHMFRTIRCLIVSIWGFQQIKARVNNISKKRAV